MPSAQVINTTRDKPDPTQIEQFFSKLGKDYRDKQDKNDVNKLLNEYQQNRQDANAWEDLQLGLEKSNISPTKRLEVQQNLNEMQKGIIQKDKALNAHVKSQYDNAQKKLEDEQKILKQKKDEQEKLDKSIKTSDEVREILIQGGETPQEAVRLSKILSPSSANARAKQNNEVKKIDAKQAQINKEEEHSKQITQKAYNEIVQLIPKAGRGTGALSVFGGENAKTFGEFTSLTGALESLLLEKVNRGTLSNVRFKYITETLLPKPTDTKNEIKGKMKGLSTILELDPSELDKLENKGSKKESSKSEVPEGKVRVKIKGSNPPKYGSVTPYEGMEAKYDIISK